MAVHFPRRASRRRPQRPASFRLSGLLQQDSPFWLGASAGLCLVYSALLVPLALGMPSGFGAWFDIAAFLLAGIPALGGFGLAAAWLLSLARVRIPRLFAGCAAGLFIEAWGITHHLNVDGRTKLVLAAVCLLAALPVAALAGLFASRRVLPVVKATLAAAIAVAAVSAPMWPASPPPAQEAPPAAAGLGPAELTVRDPSQPGAYNVRTFTYGSGSDRLRPAFGKEADVRSDTVDASVYIKRWTGLRAAYWGFGPQALPLNGTVWMPEGEGPFPLVLLLHGNHLMEQPSDRGYAYLGRNLASRGFVAVSIDENFLNDSMWSPAPDNDMKVRAWLLLQHLHWLEELSQREDGPLFGAEDLDNVALVGHSRGGQAAAMAADAGRWFKGDSVLDEIKDIRIRAVAGIAPTDTAVDGKSAALSDIDYLTLQGSRDGDLDDFYGDRQYNRTSFTPGSGHFKASLYIGGANHSRFNSDWGLFDRSLPTGLLLNERGMLRGPEQRRIALVYLMSFLEISLHGESAYEPLLRDYRTALRWLPAAPLWNRYESADFRRLTGFDGGVTKERPAAAAKGAMRGLSAWAVEPAKTRNNRDRSTNGLRLEWGGEGEAVYTLTLGGSARPGSGAGAVLSLSAADLGARRAGSGTSAAASALSQVTVRLTDADGNRVAVPLDAFMPSLPPEHVTFTVAPYLEHRLSGGRYLHPKQAVFQTYFLPLSAFRQANAAFDPARLTGISLLFDGQEGGGSIMVDDIGWYGSD